jgi:serine/threonine protein kinase
LKVADFGFATLLPGKDGSGQLHTVLGTEQYMAPEIHQEKPYSGVSVDLFAVAVILFIFIGRSPPFKKADPTNDSYYKLFCTGK